MSLQISNARFLTCGLVAAITACGTPSGEPEGPKIDCAIGPGSEFSNVCVVERVSADTFVIHHPDGGFRRFVLNEGSSPTIAVADGAEPVIAERVNPDSGLLEFELSVDRYRMDMGVLAAAPDE